MGEPLHDIDRLFKKAVEKHNELPSAKVWEQLEKNLQKRKLTSINKKYKKWKWVAAALFIFSVGLGMYTLSLKLKYNKGIEKTSGNSNINNSESSPDTKHAIGRNSYNKIDGNAVVKTDIKTKTHVNNSSGSPASAIARNTKINSVIAKSSSSITGRLGSLNKNAVRSVGSSTTSVPHTINKTEGINNYIKSIKSEVNTKKRNSLVGKEMTTTDLIASENNKSATSLTKKSITPVKLSFGKNDSLIARSFSNSYSTVGKTINLSQGLANVPDRLLKDPTSVPTFLLNTSDAARNTKANSNPALLIGGVDRGKYRFSIYYSQKLVSSNLKPNRSDFREDNYLQIRNQEKNRIASVFGLSIVRNLGRNIGIETGISLYTFTTDIGAKSLVARRDNNGKVNYRISTSSGFAYYSIKNRPNPVLADTLKTISSTKKIKYVTVPLGLQYHIYVGRKLAVNPAAVLAANFASRAKITTIQSLERTYTTELEGLKSHYFDAVLSLDISYYINRKIGISLRPSSSFALSDATEAKPVITRRNATGIAAGLHFSF